MKRRLVLAGGLLIGLSLASAGVRPAWAAPAWPVSPAGPAAGPIQTIWWIVLAIAAVIFVGVEVALVLAVLRFRSRGEGVEPRQVYGYRPIEIAWTVTPALILVVLFILTARTMHTLGAAPANAMKVTVVGHQWWWEFRYPEQGITTANELQIPAGRAVLLDLQSADVIHSFWVPLLGGKIDVVPGKPNQIWIQADRPGTYQGACAEYCGAQHAGMLLTVIARSTEQFDGWVASQQAAPAAPSGMALKGQQLFAGGTCASCHAIGGVSNAGVAPNLSHFGSRETIAAGVLSNTPANLSRWLANPQDVKPGSKMPNFKLSAEDVSNLVAYLEALK